MAKKQRLDDLAAMRRDALEEQTAGTEDSALLTDTELSDAGTDATLDDENLINPEGTTSIDKRRNQSRR